MGKIRDFFKKIGALKGIFLFFFFLSGRLYFIYISCKDEHGKGQKQSRPNRSRRNKEEVARKHRELYKKGLNDPDNHNYIVTHLEPDIQ